MEVEDGQTHTGAVMGTPSYMAPEQALGLTKHVGPAADIYALGAILYECLTGLPPFKGASNLETLDQVRRRDPVAVRQLQPAAPRDLETICMKCLAKEPTKRYSTAGELADDLQRFLQGKPIVARPVGVVEQVWKWVNRNRIVASLLAAILVVLIAGITVSSIAWANAVEEKKKAENNELLAKTNETRANDTAAKLEIESSEVRRQKGIVTQEAERRGQALAINSVRLAQSSWRERETHPETAYVWLNGVVPELRHWEWHYLNRLFEGSAYTLVEHGDEVFDLAFTRDGTKMLSASKQKFVLWDAHSCQPILNWHLPKTRVNLYRRGTIDPEGSRIASCNAAGGGLLNIATSRSISFANDEVVPHTQIAFNVEGTVLVTIASGVERDSKFQLRKPNDGSLIHEWTVAKHTITDFSFSPDGQEVALAASTATATRIIVCDYRTGRQRIAFTLNQTQNGKPTQALRVVWTPDGSNLACLIAYPSEKADSRKVAVFDAATGKTKFDSPFIMDVSASTLACSPDGLLVATGSAAGVGGHVISVWNSATGQLVRELKGHIGHITSLAFSPDGTRLVSGSVDGSIKIWDVAPQSRPFLLGTRGASLQAIAARKDGAFVATVHGEAGKASVLDPWNMTTGQRERSWEVAQEFAGCVVFSPDGREIITAGGIIDKIGEIKTWDALTGKLLSEWQADLPCMALAISPDGPMLVSAGSNLFSENFEKEPKSELKVWDRRSGKVLHNLRNGESHFYAVAFHPDGTHFVTGSRGDFTIWDGKRGQVVRTVHAHDSPVYRIAYSPDGQYLVTGSSDALRVWNAANGEWIADLEGHAGLIYALAFSPDGTRLVSSDNRASVRVWELASRQQLLKLDTPDATVTGLVFGHDNCLVGSRSDGRIQVWLARTRAASIRLEGHRYKVRATMFSPNGAYLISGNQSLRQEIPSEVKLWDTATGQLLHNLQGLKPGGIRAFAFHPASTLVAASHYSQSGVAEEIVVWNVATGQLHLRISHPEVLGGLLGFSADGKRLVAWGAGVLKAWDLTSGALVPAQVGDSTQESEAISPDQRFIAFPIGTRIHLVPNQPPSELEVSLRRQWNESVIPQRTSQSRLHLQAGRAYAAWFEAERNLFETEQPKPEDYRLRDDALLAALKQCPKHLSLVRSAARLLIARPDTNLKPADLLPILADEMSRNPSVALLQELGGLYLRDGKPDEAIASLKKAIEQRGAESPPIEELLLALAHQSKNQPDETHRWVEVAAVWLARASLPRESVSALLATCGGVVASLPGFAGVAGDSQERRANWETWRTLRALQAQLPDKFEQ